MNSPDDLYLYPRLPAMNVDYCAASRGSPATAAGTASTTGSLRIGKLSAPPPAPLPSGGWSSRKTLPYADKTNHIRTENA